MCGSQYVGKEVDTCVCVLAIQHNITCFGIVVSPHGGWGENQKW